MIHSSFLSSFAASYAPLYDPPGSSALVAAVSWIEGTLLGTVATSVAVIAVASVGFMMLTGRLSVRPALSVILGSFILFGAPTIARGISASAGGDRVASLPALSPPPLLATAGVPASGPPAASDPYAGASVPSE